MCEKFPIAFQQGSLENNNKGSESLVLISPTIPNPFSFSWPGYQLFFPEFDSIGRGSVGCVLSWLKHLNEVCLDVYVLSNE